MMDGFRQGLLKFALEHQCTPSTLLEYSKLKTISSHSRQTVTPSDSMEFFLCATSCIDMDIKNYLFLKPLVLCIIYAFRISLTKSSYCSSGVTTSSAMGL